MRDDFQVAGLLLVLVLLVLAGLLFGWAIWGKDRTLECDIAVDGRVYKCSTTPKISSEKVIKFLNGDRYVEIPIDKEVIIIFDK